MANTQDPGQVYDFIKLSRQAGQTDEQIRQALIGGGWTADQVDMVLSVSKSGAPAAPTASTASAQPATQSLIKRKVLTPLRNNTPAKPTPSPAPLPDNTPRPATAVPNVQSANFPATAFPTPSIPRPIPSMPQEQPVKRSSLPGLKGRIPLIPIGVVVAALIIVFVIVGLLSNKAGYQDVAQQFITAVHENDQAKADKLQSPAMLLYLQNNAATSSFENLCKSSDQLCMPLFDPTFIKKAQKTYQDYTANDGTKGKKITYTLVQTINSGGSSCQTTSKNTLTLSLVPSGKSWLVDSANPSI
ncbi:MAG: hypothetical protein ACXWLH_06555, partial [Candidatus Saccharimonadales bacterium]